MLTMREIMAVVRLGFWMVLGCMAQPAWAEAPAFRAGELMVKFKSGAQAETVHRGLAVQRLARWGRWEHVKLPAGADTEAMRRWYLDQPGVEAAEFNRYARKAALPNDPLFPLQWGLHNTGQVVGGAAGTPSADIGAAAAWDRHTGSRAVVVAIIDSGIDRHHPDLAANLWVNPREIADNGIDDDGNGKVDDVWGWNFVANNNRPQDDDVDGGHGSHVAGIVGAVGNNGKGVAGVNWQVSLMAVKVLNAYGYAADSDIVAGIDYAVGEGARVLNLSLTYGCGQTGSLSVREALQRAAERGVLVVVAAGNDGCDNDARATYPGSWPISTLLAVGASDAHDRPAVFERRRGSSSYGAQSVHLFAPGKHIYSTLIVARGPYGLESGTSMAAPFVSGAAALLMAHRPGLATRQVREILLLAARPLDALQGLAVTGGRLDLGAAMDYELAASRPIQPSHVRLSAQAGSFRLSWQDDSTIEQGWVLQVRSAPDDAFRDLVTLPQGTTEYLDSGTVGGEGTYVGYRVLAFNALGRSSSNEVRLVTPPAAPDDLRATASGLKVTLAWRDRSQRESRYHVERATGDAAFAEIAQLSANTTAYEDTVAQAGVAYRYRVRAWNAAAGYSSYSVVASVTPAAVQTDEGGTRVGCFIATAAYGSALHPKVDSLRRLRDEYLMTSAVGRALVSGYYRLSPPLAELVARHEALRTVTRALLWPLVWLAERLTGEAQAGAFFRPRAQEEAAGRAATEEHPAQRQLLAKFHPQVEAREAEAILRSHGAIEVRVVAARLWLAGFADPAARDRAIEALARDARVEYAEPNRLARQP